MGLLFTVAAYPLQRSHSQVRVPRTIFSCLKIRDWRARSPYLYPPGGGWPGYTPRLWVPFSSPPTTRRVTVEVFEPASTQVHVREMRNATKIDSENLKQDIEVKSRAIPVTGRGAYRVRRRGSHIFYTLGSQMAVRLLALRACRALPL
jgi:hypothetical protein